MNVHDDAAHDRVGRITIVGGGSAGWMAAAALATYVGTGTTIRLVESEAIGIVGVGEASVPHLRLFNSQWLGIDEADFVRRTQATAKLGIQFKDWGRLGDSYIHGFGAPGRSLGPLPFHQLWLKQRLAGKAGPIGDYSAQGLMAPLGKFAPASAMRRRIRRWPTSPMPITSTPPCMRASCANWRKAAAWSASKARSPTSINAPATASSSR